jgi:hypothetical protein
VTLAGHDGGMTKTAPQAPTAETDVLYHVDFHLSFEPNALQKYWGSCDVAKGIRQGDETVWEHDGIASFDVPPLAVPRVGQDIIPYFIYHLEQWRDWLTQEHVSRVFGGVEAKIGTGVGEPVSQSPLRLV